MICFWYMWWLYFLKMRTCTLRKSYFIHKKKKSKSCKIYLVLTFVPLMFFASCANITDLNFSTGAVIRVDRRLRSVRNLKCF